MPATPSYKKLHKAIKEQNLELMKECFKEGIEVINYQNDKNNYIDCSLHLAIGSKNYEAVELCFNNGAKVANDVKWRNNDSINYSFTTLHLAIESKNDKIVELCLKKGALVVNDAKKTNGDPCLIFNSLYEAIQTKSDKIIDLILLYGGDVNCLTESSKANKTELINRQNSLLERRLFENSVMLFKNKFGKRFATNEIIEKILQFTVDGKSIKPANSVKIIMAAQMFEFKDKIQSKM